MSLPEASGLAQVGNLAGAATKHSCSLRACVVNMQVLEFFGLSIFFVYQLRAFIRFVDPEKTLFSQQEAHFS